MRLPLALALSASLSTHAQAMSLNPGIVGLSQNWPWAIAYGIEGVLGFILIATLVFAAREFSDLFARIIIGALCLVACLVTTAAWALDNDGTEPDPVLTPGAVRTTDKAEICGHRTGEFRHVTVTEKVASRRAYGIISEFDGYCGNVDENGKRGCEQDHRIPLVVGGGNPPGSITNIWTQRPDGPFGYHVKDKCEERVGRDICNDKISVADAQAVFFGDWRKTCRPWVPELPNVE